MILSPFDKRRAGYEALGGCVAKGAVAVANDDAGGTQKPRLMGLSSGAGFECKTLVLWADFLDP